MFDLYGFLEKVVCVVFLILFRGVSVQSYVCYTEVSKKKAQEMVKAVNDKHGEDGMFPFEAISMHNMPDSLTAAVRKKKLHRTLVEGDILLVHYYAGGLFTGRHIQIKVFGRKQL